MYKNKYRKESVIFYWKRFLKYGNKKFDLLVKLWDYGFYKFKNVFL